MAPLAFTLRALPSARAISALGGTPVTDTPADFEAFFQSGSQGHCPYPYQVRLTETRWPETLVIPTGFGKTAAVLAAWLWKVARSDGGTPRRLVYCLPMRTLVEQTADAARTWIGAADTELGLAVELDVVMGGRAEGRRGLPRWMLHPERPAILIGTQDLLVSAALMRGYGVSRYRWPVDFALLHNDALWVIDEVQLTGATLATSSQLEAFRRDLGLGRSSRTLWMSATLDPAWLKTVDFDPPDSHRPHDLSAEDLSRAPHLWEATKKLRRLDLSEHDLGKKEGDYSYAAAVAAEARACTRPGTTTLVFLNTVSRAQGVFDALGGPGDRFMPLLVHSRFRPAERRRLLSQLRTPPPAEGRIVVATQALEAGVDVTSAALISELAPWSSLVQRFGRCNRYGECGETGAEVAWIDLPAKAARPYDAEELADARAKLVQLTRCGLPDLAETAPSAPPRAHVIRRRDFLDLFDTEPDLSGFDVDVSLYVRDAQDTDVRLFWRDVAAGGGPSTDAPASSPEELCPAPVGAARDLVKRAAGRVWHWDSLASKWQATGRGDVRPGMTVWVDAAVGGYDPVRGFDALSKERVAPAVAGIAGAPAMVADPDAASRAHVSLSRHTAHVRDQATTLAEALGLHDAERNALIEVARWHDLGKAHPAFVLRMRGASPPLAKAPDFTARPSGDPRDTRPYFRHELASALAYLANHAWADEADLPAYLIAAHHGKVRTRLRALPKEPPPGEDRLFARGVWDGDLLPATDLGGFSTPETPLSLDIMQLGEGPYGPSWSARALRLLEKQGPFRLAWLEALVRIADWRASEAEEEADYDDL
jgi:CRISPR-associated endonuclease/helicase Cas3